MEKRGAEPPGTAGRAGGTRLPKGWELLARPQRCRIAERGRDGLVELPGLCPCVRFHPRPVLGWAFLFQGYFGMVRAFRQYNSRSFPFALKSKGPFVSRSPPSPQEY